MGAGGRPRLTDADLKEIAHLRAAGWTPAAIAARKGTTRQAIAYRLKQMLGLPTATNGGKVTEPSVDVASTAPPTEADLRGDVRRLIRYGLGVTAKALKAANEGGNYGEGSRIMGRDLTAVYAALRAAESNISIEAAPGSTVNLSVVEQRIEVAVAAMHAVLSEGVSNDAEREWCLRELAVRLRPALEAG